MLNRAGARSFWQMTRRVLFEDRNDCNAVARIFYTTQLCSRRPQLPQGFGSGSDDCVAHERAGGGRSVQPFVESNLRATHRWKVGTTADGGHH